MIGSLVDSVSEKLKQKAAEIKSGIDGAEALVFPSPLFCFLSQGKILLRTIICIDHNHRVNFLLRIRLGSVPTRVFFSGAIYA